MPDNTKDFTRVMILDTGEVCEVIDYLSSMFTVKPETSTVQFHFYKDKGVTWQEAD